MRWGTKGCLAGVIGEEEHLAAATVCHLEFVRNSPVMKHSCLAMERKEESRMLLALQASSFSSIFCFVIVLISSSSFSERGMSFS